MSVEPKKRGRPKGAKNKSKAEVSAAKVASSTLAPLAAVAKPVERVEPENLPQKFVPKARGAKQPRKTRKEQAKPRQSQTRNVIWILALLGISSMALLMGFSNREALLEWITRKRNGFGKRFQEPQTSSE